MLDWIRKFICGPCGDEEELRGKLAEAEADVERLKNNYAIIYGKNEECEKEAIRINLENKSLSMQLSEANDEKQHLLEKISEMEMDVNTCSASLADKEFPTIIKAKTDPKETVYKTGFGIYYKNVQYFDKFKEVAEPVYVGGVAWRYVLDKEYFKRGMTALEVFNMALKIVQTKYGYRSDTELYGPADSWAPPLLTDTFKYGDCEDTTAFVVNIFLTYEQAYGPFMDHYCAIGCGYIRGMCHAFPVLINIVGTDSRKHYIGESTLSSYVPAKTFYDCRNDYELNLGVIGHPIIGNMDGGFVLKKEYWFWGTSTGGNMEKKPVQVGGNEAKKKKVLKEIWGAKK